MFPYDMTWDPQEGLIYVANSFSSSISVIKDEQSVMAEHKSKSCFLDQVLLEPNPFSHHSGLVFSIPPTERAVIIKIYNSIGQLVRVLRRDKKENAASKIVWNGRDNCGRYLSSGVYFCQICAGDQSITKQIVLVK
jgi:hypothetical protein